MEETNSFSAGSHEIDFCGRIRMLRSITGFTVCMNHNECNLQVNILHTL